jgi:NTE family protein
MPLVFAPVKRDDMLLVDGGLINPVPIAPTLNDNAAWTFAVDLNAPAEALPEAKQPPIEPGESKSRFQKAIASFVDSIVQGTSKSGEDYPGPLELALNSMDTMQTTIARMKLSAYEPRMVIRVPRNLCTIFEFHRARELIDFGYRRTEKSLERLLED